VGVTPRQDDGLVTFLLVLAAVLFLLGLFTAKLLWLVAVVLVVVWLAGKVRSGSSRSMR
jgi:hypothetical protein